MPFDPTPTNETLTKQAVRVALTDIANLLPTIPDKQWEFESWLVTGRERLSLPLSKIFCGTVGCAIGHGIKRLPSVKALLQFSANGKPVGMRGEAPWKALHMSSSDFYSLFTPDGYYGTPTQQQVAANIREHLARTA